MNTKQPNPMAIVVIEGGNLPSEADLRTALAPLMKATGLNPKSLAVEHLLFEKERQWTDGCMLGDD